MVEKTKRSRGRPSKFTANTRRRIIEAVASGNYYEAACQYAGVDYSTFRRWVEKGEKARSGEYKDFCEALRQAEATAEVRVVAQWQTAMPNDWRACAEFLTRRFSDRWKKTERFEHVGKDENEPITFLFNVVDSNAENPESLS